MAKGARKRRVRVLQVIDRLGPGGAEMLLYTLASGIDRGRFDLRVCGLRSGRLYTLVPQLRAIGTPVIEFDQRNAYDIPTLLSLVRYIRRHRIDIIHTHLLASDIMGRMAGLLTHTPVVSTVHNSREDFDLEPARRQWMERWTARLMCRRLVLVSGTIREEIAGWYGLPPSRFVTIPNGVDTGRFRPMPDIDAAAYKRALFGADASECKLVLNVARLVPQKGQSYLLQAARQILGRRPDVRFAIVGLTDLGGSTGDDLARQAGEMGLGGRVAFTGARDDISQLLAASDLFVLSSLWEGLPVSLLEAMAAGCPVVSTDVGGVGAVLQGGVTGLLVPPANASALAAMMLEVLDRPEEAQARAHAARAWVVQNYSMQVWVGRLEALYLREVGGRPSP